MILRDFKNGNCRNEDVTDVSVGESDSIEEQVCKIAFQNRKYVGPDDSSDVLSLANDRIGVAKYDFEQYRWKIVTNRGTNTGIRSIVNPTKLTGQITFQKLKFTREEDRNVTKNP